MLSPRLPDVHASGRMWHAAELHARAATWRDAIDDVVGSGSVGCAVAVPGSAEGIALLAAGLSRRAPLVVVGDTAESWAAGALAAVPALALPPSLSHLADAARSRGLAPILLPDASSSTAPPLDLLSTQGVVVSTSGSTGAPKPVFRPMSRMVAGAMARATALDLRPGDGLVGSVGLASGQGVVHAVTAFMLGGPLHIVGRVDYRELLGALADPAVACWRATAQFAELLGRVPMPSVPRVPPIVLVSSAVSELVHERFVSRFGVPLRGAYSSSESGAIAVDAGPAAEVVAGTVGRPLAGVEVVIGDRPDGTMATPDTSGRIWVRSPWLMAGYGVPPALTWPGDDAGWLATRDLGQLERDGRLRLMGRLDDCVRTREGRLVNLEAVAAQLREVPGVRAVQVLPLVRDAGPTFGALIESDLASALLRERIGHSVEEWARPRVLAVLPELPRLPNGKADRLACLSLLDGVAV